MSFEKRIGLLVPSSNTSVEAEFHRLLPAGVTQHVARLFIARVEPDSIERMVETLEAQSRLLASADVDLIMLCATAPSFLKGQGYDREIGKRIEDATGKPATTTSTALLDALRALGIQRLALGSAFTPTVNGICAGFLEANGHRVVAQDGLNKLDNLEIGRLDVETAFDLGTRIDRDDAQAIVLACTNWRTIDVIDRLEQRLNKPVLTTTQVSAWHALRKLGYGGSIAGYGTLLRDHLAPQAA
ncbi:aspartate/glutamate racemase family protein [Pigmentiphaga soli]|uniref:Aspartate/glutamate racemase family protein n=1 Tax=Pigmentiphaga soli TaxID=1007095 RepID=A0ABP8GHG1_9BURK